MFLFGRARGTRQRTSRWAMSLLIAATTAAGPSHLTGTDWIVALSLTVGLIIAAGLVVVFGRSKRDGVDVKSPDRTIMRSWLAIALTGGLLLFTVVSFGIDDPSLRSALVGGVVASAGAAVAFYFASKSADQA